MATKRHIVFNLSILIFPWLSLRFLSKRNLKRYSFSCVLIVIIEILNHLYGRRRKWWKFYEKRKSFLRDELPFDIGLYLPLTMWILKLTYGNFKHFIILNGIVNGIFAFFVMDILKKTKIVRLNRLNRIQFFIYLHYKAYILYGVQNLVEKILNHKSVTN
jgi:hypothetical protein